MNKEELINEITLLYKTYTPWDYFVWKRLYEEQLEQSSIEELYKRLEQMKYLGFLRSE
jgi:hypothetical protein